MHRQWFPGRLLTVTTLTYDRSVHRWGRVALVMALAIGGCGKAEQADDAPATAADTVPATARAAPETVAAAPTTIEADESEMPEGYLPAAPNDTTSQTEYAGLSLDDPLPAQPDGVTDPAGAETAIRFAYEHWILVDLDAELRGRLMENGEAHAVEMAEGFARQRLSLEGATIGVETVTFTDAEHADVTYQVNWLGHPSPYFPEPRTGQAMLQNGTWRITKSDVCTLAIGGGFGCPLQDGENPQPPEALLVAAVPPGLVREETGVGDVLNMSDMGNWVGAGDSWITIWYNQRPGLSKLSPEEADAFLLDATGGSGSVPVTIAGQPARYFRNETEMYGRPVTMFLVEWIRGDDVLVQANVSNVPIEQVLAALESMTPTEYVVTI